MSHQDDDLRGVSGWLAFFILTLTVFGPVRTIFSLFGNLYSDPTVAAHFNDRWPLVQTIEWALHLAVVGVTFFLGWRLYTVHVWRSVEMTIFGIWLLSPAILLSEAVALWLIADLPIGDMFDGAGYGVIRWLGYGTIWTAYLLRSVRVANTYPCQPDEDAAAVFE